MRKNAITALGACILLTTAAWGASRPAVKVRQPELIPAGEVVSLQDAISIAMKNEPTIRQAAAEVQLRSGLLGESRSRLLPALSVNSGTTLAANQRDKGTTLNATVDQLVTDFGRSKALLSQAQQQRLASESAYTVAAFDLVYNVKQSYYTTLRTQRLVQVFEENVKAQDGHVAQAQARFDVGSAPKSDVLKAAAAAASARVDLVAARNNYEQARADLNEAIGVDLRSQTQVAEVSEPVVDVPDLDGAVEAAMRNRQEVIQAERQVLADQAALTAAEKGNMPALTTAVGDTASFGNDLASPNSVAWLLNVQWTPFDAGLTRGEITASQAQLTQSLETLYSTRQTVSRDVVAARLNLTATQEALTAATAEVASAQEDVNAAIGRYEGSVGILLEVLDAQAALLKAQVDEALARYGLSIARAQLQRAQGTTVVEGMGK